jgi:hypothetical protein
MFALIGPALMPRRQLITLVLVLVQLQPEAPDRKAQHLRSTRPIVLAKRQRVENVAPLNFG